jgi:hypothetical protein
MLLKEKSAHALMKSIMSKLMGTDKSLPFAGKLVMNNDEPTSELAIVDASGVRSEIVEPNLDTHRPCNCKRAVGFMSLNKLEYGIFHDHHPANSISKAVKAYEFTA